MARMAVPASLRDFSLQNYVSLKSFLVTLVALFACFAIYIAWLAFHPDAPKQFAKMAEVTVVLEVAPEEPATPASPTQADIAPIELPDAATPATAEPVDETITTAPSVAPTGIIITDVGFSAKKFDLIKKNLPKGTTLIFDPHTPNLQQKVAEAIQHSFVVKLKLPLQPTDFPYKDAGIMALMVKDSPETIKQKIEKLSALAPEASGFIMPTSSAFDNVPEQKQEILKILGEKMVAYEDMPNKVVSVNDAEFLELVK